MRLPAGLLLLVALTGRVAVAQVPPEPRERQDLLQPPDDAAIEQRLRSIFGEIDAFDALTITVRHGVVELAGTAPSAAVRERAEAVARRLPGVVYVEDKTKPPPVLAGGPSGAGDPNEPTPQDQRIGERIRSIFDRVEDLRDVTVDVTAGVVELRGRVLDGATRDKAEQLAKGIAGVVFVSNRLEETVDLRERFLPSVRRVGRWLQDLVLLLPLLAVGAFLVALFWWLARRLGRADRLFGRFTDNKLIQGIARQIAKTVLVLVGLYLGLEIVGATTLVGAVLGTAGVVGLALGFAFRDIVENYLASIILSIRQPFRTKDLVEINGSLGHVVRMTTRDTVLLTLEGNHVTLPNGTVFKSKIVNYTRAPLRRFAVAVGVGTGVDLKAAMQHGLGVLHDMAGVVDDPEPFARVEELGESNVLLRFFGWVDQPTADWFKVQSEAVRLIKEVMDEHDIEMPVPIQRVQFERAPDLEQQDPQAKSGRRGSAREQAAAADVEPERQIEEQVEQDLRHSDEEDLLQRPETLPPERPAR